MSSLLRGGFEIHLFRMSDSIVRSARFPKIVCFTNTIMCGAQLLYGVLQAAQRSISSSTQMFNCLTLSQTQRQTAKINRLRVLVRFVPSWMRRRLWGTNVGACLVCPRCTIMAESHLAVHQTVDEAPLEDPKPRIPLAALKWPYVPDESAYPDPLKRDDPKTLQLHQYESIGMCGTEVYLLTNAISSHLAHHPESPQ